MKKPSDKNSRPLASGEYSSLVGNIGELLETARRTSARAVNALMTATYWEIGTRIVEFEQGGEKRAEYGKEMLKNLSVDLTARFGRGFGYAQINHIRQFYRSYPSILKSAIVESDSKPQTAPQSSANRFQNSRAIDLRELANRFPLTWTHYTRLLRVKKSLTREFYEVETLRNGWTVRQLERQINSQFYERTALSSNKASMLARGARSIPEDLLTADEEVRDPLILEFLNLKDEYSESDLENALIQHLEHFLLELGGASTFVGRQRRLRIDHEWFRVDLLFFHRRLRSRVVIDLKIGALYHADVGQMHLSLNYARENWCEQGENPPIGLILCTEKSESLAHDALQGLPNKMLVRDYLTALPDEDTLAKGNRLRSPQTRSA